MWYALYYSTQREKKDAAPLRALIDRPFGAAAVGWSVQARRTPKRQDVLSRPNDRLELAETPWRNRVF